MKNPLTSPPSARARILGWYMLLLAVAIVAALLIQRRFMLTEVITETDRALDQEIAEVRQLAGGIDPETGEPFGTDVAAIFDLFLSRNVGVGGEGVVTILDGDLYKGDVLGSRYSNLPGLEARWTRIDSPTRDQVETEIGPIRFLAVPLETGGAIDGVFVTAIALQERLDRVDEVVRLGALVFGTIFVVASAGAWLAAGAILKPLRTLRDTAQTITESDLTRRIEVTGTDEIADLTDTFNQMLDRLEEAFATQRVFVDDAGHELRTPITVIRGQLELLDDDPAERDRTIALVTTELDRMSRIVEDLLVLAKAEQPDFVVSRPVDLAEMVADVGDKSSRVTGREVAVETVDHAVIEADEQRLTQALMNLTRNAAEHTPTGTRIALGATASPDETHIWVTDDGPGIPEAEREHVFERFGRGSDGRRTTEGAGLGLAIVRAIAEGHGGRVHLTTGARGTTFTIVLPNGDRGENEGPWEESS